MAFKFSRGRQMVIHDPRLNNPHTTPPTTLTPPGAMNTWTVSLSDTPDKIISWANTVAKGDAGTSQLDGLHFMAHGTTSGIQIGSGWLNWGNVDLFKKLAGRVKGAIVFFACQVGGEQSSKSLEYELTYGKAVATYANCKVVTCKQNQVYSWDANGLIDFGGFEGNVYVYEAGGGTRLLNISDKTKVDLEAIIFP